MDFGERPFFTHHISGQGTVHNSHSGLEFGEGGLPWLPGVASQLYVSDVLTTNNEQRVHAIFQGTEAPMLPSNQSWDESGDFVHRSQVTAPALPYQGLTNTYDEHHTFPLQYSTSNSTSTADFAELSHSRDMLSQSTPSTPTSPTSPSDETDSVAGFNSTTMSALPSSERFSKPGRRSSRVSNADSDKRDSVSCSNCETNNTSLWRRTNDGQPICNACGLFVRLHGIPRPLSLKTNVVKKRKRERQSVTHPGGGRSGGLRSRTPRNSGKEKPQFE